MSGERLLADTNVLIRMFAGEETIVGLPPALAARGVAR